MKRRRFFCHYSAKLSQLQRKYIKSSQRGRYTDRTRDWTTDEMWFDSWHGREIPLLSDLSIPGLNPIPSTDTEALSSQLKRWGVNLPTHLILVPRLRISGDILPFFLKISRRTQGQL